jgi:hypothetical protein
MQTAPTNAWAVSKLEDLCAQMRLSLGEFVVMMKIMIEIFAQSILKYME